MSRFERRERVDQHVAAAPPPRAGPSAPTDSTFGIAADRAAARGDGVARVVDVAVRRRAAAAAARPARRRRAASWRAAGSSGTSASCACASSGHSCSSRQRLAPITKMRSGRREEQRSCPAPSASGRTTPTAAPRSGTIACGPKSAPANVVRHVVRPRANHQSRFTPEFRRSAAKASRSLSTKLSYQPPTENTGTRDLRQSARAC